MTQETKEIEESEEEISDVTIFFDGASKNNPGVSGCGWVIIDHRSKESKEKEGYKYCGDHKTNNEAEYSALLYALEDFEVYLKDSKNALQSEDSKILIIGDSKLVIQQLDHVINIKAENLRPIFNKIQKKFELLRKDGFKIKLKHVPRLQNKRADKLSNDAIKNHLKSLTSLM